MAMDIGAFYSNVVITLLIVLTLFILILAWLYMIYAKKEPTTGTTTTEPKTKPEKA